MSKKLKPKDSAVITAISIEDCHHQDLHLIGSTVVCGDDIEHLGDGWYTGYAGGKFYYRVKLKPV